MQMSTAMNYFAKSYAKCMLTAR